MSPADIADKTVNGDSQDKVEFGQKLAKRKSQEFAAKVARWNSSGGGLHNPKEKEEIIVIDQRSIKSDSSEAPAPVVIGPGLLTEVVELQRETTSPPTASRKTARNVDLNRKAWVRRKSKSQVDKPAEKVEPTPDIKHAGTPKKRVVSDGHWRRDRIVKPARAEEPEEETPIPVPKPIVLRESTAKIGLKTSPGADNLIAEREERAARRRAARKPRSPSPSISQSRSTEARDETPDYESSGTRVYIKKRSANAHLNSRPVSSDLKRAEPGDLGFSRASSQQEGKSTDAKPALAPPSPAVQRYLKLLVPVEDQISPKEAADAPPERLSRRRQNSRKSPRPSNQRDSDLTQDDASHEENAAPAPPVVYGSRIQGWLATTSDPFESSADTRPQVDRSRWKVQSESVEPRSESADGQRSSRLPIQRTPEESPKTPTLKRRGATRTATSPVKHRVSSDLARVLDSDIENDRASLVPRPLSLQIRSSPNTGRELSTINSVAPLDRQRFLTDGSLLSRASDGDERQSTTTLKRRLTKHEDLMSVLSAQRASNRVLRNRDSTRSLQRSPGDIMNEVTTDELKYQRELRTLVDGVIPVLLQYVLSTNEASRKSGDSHQDSRMITKPIVDMGVALERLKNVHKRIAMHDARDLLVWAEAARPIYTGYLAAWRLGFQDIVVNLAPAESSEQRWDNGIPRNSRGNIATGEGAERVDVAYLLKRPLVRLKQLAKTFEVLTQLDPALNAQHVVFHFDELLQQARLRVNEEKARLEDEAAAAVDPTRARECRTLAPIADVEVDATRCVRARDFFDLDFRHTSGQQINCKVEMIIRDDAPDKGAAGDVLFCEVSTSGKWLLFPPVHSTMLSARRGRKAGQMVVMLRGYRNDGREWREVLSLETDDEGCVNEWLTMLPSSPIPRSLATKSSFDLKHDPVMSGALPEPSEGGLERLPSVREIEVPLGERLDEPTERWDASEVNSDAGSMRSKALRRKRIVRHRSQPAEPIAEEPYAYERQEMPQDINRQARGRPMSEYYMSTTKDSISATARPFSTEEYSTQPPSSRRPSDESSADETDQMARRPTLWRRTSSVPSLDFPTVNKLRKDTSTTPQKKAAVREPASAPAKITKRRTTPPELTPASPTTHEPRSRPTSFGLKSGILPSFTPAFLKKHRRSSSPLKHEYEPSTASSLSDSEVSAVHENDESYTSDSSTEQQPDDQISTLGELKSFPTYGGYKQMRQATPPESLYAPSGPSLAPSQSASQAPYRAVPTTQAALSETVASLFAWADSGSWDSLHPEDCCIIVTPGLIEAFDSTQAHAAPALNDEEFPQSPSARGVKPLVALELTPLVPLRRGTALDISIRSPPTANSLYRTGNNIMFRSRNAEECEKLYHLLNRARVDHPTYVSLQRARGPAAHSNWGELMEQRAQARSVSGSWFAGLSRKGSTYRSKSSARPQSIAATESSVGTMQTAFSALRRFSGSNKIFNIAKSTITSRQGTRSTYSDSLDSGVASPAFIDPSMGTPVGMTNMKIRLYVRETASKWRDMGAARLTILIPPRPDPTLPANPMLTGREKRVIVSGKTQGEVLVDATLGETSFERIARTGIAMSVWEENVDGLVATTGGVLAAKTTVYMVQMKSDREAAYTFGLVGKLRY